LLNNKTRVVNNFELDNLQKFTIITGANMAGKSTFLRAIGVNLILAMSGASVSATKFSFTPLPLFSSMRTADSLSENESYFYSELKRLQLIVNKLKSGEKLFIILDEILKGTNSKDKAEGSKKFVQQLINYKTAGIIATHDLSLCSLKNDFPSQIENSYFDVEIENDNLIFDYKLKPGICSNMNAQFLMKKMGITNSI
jgi:DNA mismatch repair ATPase MutS